MLPSMYVKGPEEENSGISFDRLAFSNCEEVVCNLRPAWSINATPDLFTCKGRKEKECVLFLWDIWTI